MRIQNTKPNIAEEISDESCVGKTTSAIDDEDRENEGDPTRVVEPVIIENTNPTVTYGKGSTRTLTL